jgi:hypothetical protein
VNLANEMFNLKGSLNGTYEFATIVDGKPSYVNDYKAIWYDSSNTLWVIGSVENIGQNSASMLAYDGFSGLTDPNNEWLHYFEGSWVPSSPNDINITCKNGETLIPLMNGTLGLCLINLNWNRLAL